MSSDKLCKKCKEILVFETRLSKQARQFLERVRTDIAPVVQRNNKRWRRFAELVSLPLVGKRILRFRVAPSGLEPIVLPEHTSWYLKEINEIQGGAQTLESLMRNDLEHWGNGIVETADPHDPSGQTTPHYAPRSWCVEKGIPAATPPRFDFSSIHGRERFFNDVLVMCSDTKRIVPLQRCILSFGKHTKWKPVYHSKHKLD